MKVELVKPQGYCGGVTNAIKMAYQAKKENLGKKIYVLGALVHGSTGPPLRQRRGPLVVETERSRVKHGMTIIN